MALNDAMTPRLSVRIFMTHLLAALISETMMYDVIENFTWKYTSLDREASLARPPSMTLRSHLTRGVEVLPALAHDSVCQVEISLHSVTENLADRPIRPDKSGQEMHTNPAPVFI